VAQLDALALLSVQKFIPKITMLHHAKLAALQAYAPDIFLQISS
jgi:hypothetical protein